MHGSRFVLLTTLAAGSVAASAAADVTFTDTEFTASNWGFETAILGAGGTSTPSQVAGGNPGNARQLTNVVNGGGTIFGFSRFGTTTSTRYDPASQGAILSVDWSIDSRWLSGIGGQGQLIALGIKQGTVTYIADSDITGSSGNWITHGAITLTAADFQPLTSGPVIDFSATAAPLRFGFIVGNSSTGAGYGNTVMYDNFGVTVHSVPASMSACAAAMGLAAGLRRRRKS